MTKIINIDGEYINVAHITSLKLVRGFRANKNMRRGKIFTILGRKIWLRDSHSSYWHDPHVIMTLAGKHNNVYWFKSNFQAEKLFHYIRAEWEFSLAIACTCAK